MAKWSGGLLGGLALVAVAILPLQVSAVEVEGAGEKVDHTCAKGEEVVVSGMNNVVRLSGPCGGLSVEGSGNDIRGSVSGGKVSVGGTENVLSLSLPPKTRISVEGVDNQVEYVLSGKGDKPVVKTSGSNNRVYPQR